VSIGKDPGAPVALYEILQAAGEPELIDREVPPGAALLELGCGAGRITHPLVALGRQVVAVDFDADMLAHVRGAETVLSRIEDLRLGRTFGGVVLMSNLVNTRDDAQRAALLASCQRHVEPGGVVLIERYDPNSGIDTTPTETRRFGLTIRVTDIRREGPLLFWTIEYDAGDRGTWSFRLEGARVLSDDETVAALAAAGLRLERWLDERRRWLAASPRIREDARRIREREELA